VHAPSDRDHQLLRRAAFGAGHRVRGIREDNSVLAHTWKKRSKCTRIARRPDLERFACRSVSLSWLSQRHETILHPFAGGSGDGAAPQAALAMDKNGNRFGTTMLGGSGNEGTVFEVSKDGKSYAVIYDFLRAATPMP